MEKSNTGYLKINTSKDLTGIKDRYNLECPVCKAIPIAGSQVFQCQNGHLICSKCQPKLSTCPVCRVGMATKIRNSVAEKIIADLPKPCRYTENGCDYTLGLQLDLHEKYCTYRPVQCPALGACSCYAKVLIKDLKQHVESAHKDRIAKCVGSGDPTMVRVLKDDFAPSKMTDRSWPGTFYQLKERGDKFASAVWRSGQRWYFWVYCFGDDLKANTFDYDLKLLSQGSKGRVVLQYSGVPVSVDVMKAKVASTGCCLILDETFVKSQIWNPITSEVVFKVDIRPKFSFGDALKNFKLDCKGDKESKATTTTKPFDFKALSPRSGSALASFSFANPAANGRDQQNNLFSFGKPVDENKNTADSDKDKKPLTK